VFNSLKYGLLSALVLGTTLYGDTIGIIGGKNLSVTPNPPMAFLVSSTGSLTPLSFPTVANGAITSVAINNFGESLIGGVNLIGFSPIAFLASSTGDVSPLSLSATPSGFVNSVAISDSGIGLIGGGIPGGGTPIAYHVASTGGTNYITTVPSAAFTSVAINSSGQGIIGGEVTAGAEPPLAYFISSDGTPTIINLPLATKGIINGVAINDYGVALLGGQNNPVAPPNAGPPIAYLATPSNLIPITFPSQITAGVIEDVAINNSGIGLIAGADTSSSGTIIPIAFRVSQNGSLQALDVSSLGSAGFLTVALNNSGAGLLGGATAANTVLAVLMSPTGNLTSLNLSPIQGGFVNDVVINDYGAGIIGGFTNSFAPFAFLVSPTGNLTVLDLPVSSGTIVAVAIKALSHIPTYTLHGNNLIFAEYINQNAPYDAFYFVPSVLNGTLADALESAAPTRNAIGLFTANNNLLFLNQSFSRHSRDSRQYRHEKVTQGILLAENEGVNLAENDLKNEPKRLIANPVVQSNAIEAAKENHPYQLWGEIIGAAAYQKSQDQTPAFQPLTGGAIVAFDAHGTDHGWYGGGAAYTYTHIHEENGYGHSHVNQEYLFIYGLWNNAHFYGDLAIWGGLFQIDNVRNISMTGFDFTSKSHPNGWQLAPHVEVGYDSDVAYHTMIEPFVMFDWINNWQKHYRESGNSPFNAGQKSHYSSFLRSEAGLRFYETIKFDSWNLVLQEKGSYVNKAPFHVGTVTAFLVGAPGSFTVETFTKTQNLAAVEMQFLFEPANTRYPYGAIAYQGEFGSKYQSHQLAVNICWNF
jgi:hypothetical protein